MKKNNRGKMRAEMKTGETHIGGSLEAADDVLEDHQLTRSEFGVVGGIAELGGRVVGRRHVCDAVVEM